MAAVQQRKLVHKQFNSPIGLYSDNNVKATLDRDLKMMSNGTMGVDYDPSEQPANLANSAVLKMLQEEENAKRNGPRTGGLKRVAWPPEEYHSPSRVVPHPENQPPIHRFQSASPQYQTDPQQFYPSATTQQYHYRQPSPGMVTLRKETPIMQETSPVFSSQPAAAKFGGGTNMRGDQKWPPQEYKQSEVENAERRRLAQGPVFRPRRVQKDYTDFFNAHALNSTYPSYRAPPGTQHSIAQ